MGMNLLFDIGENSEEKKDIWYDPKRIMSYHALFNFIITPRGQGKSFAFKKICIKNALYKNEQFMLLRRTEVELKDSLDSFFRNMQAEFPNYSMRIWKNMVQMIELNPDTGEPYDGEKWMTVGYGAYLSNARRKKSISYDGVTTIIFDEFCIPTSSRDRYLEDEVTLFLDFYETVARLRDVTVFFLGNATQALNPYFLYFNIQIPQNRRGIRRFGKDCVVEYSSNKDFEEVKKQSRFGQLIAGTDFEKYAIENQFIDEPINAIEKKDKTYKYFATMIIDGESFGIYFSAKYGKAIASEDVNSQCPRRILFNKNSKYQKSFELSMKHGSMKYIKEIFMAGALSYESERIQQIFWNLFRRIIR